MSAAPRFLIGPGFVLWGFCLGQPLLGAVIGVAYEALRLAGFRRRLSDAELRRSADLASVLSLVAVVYFIASIGMPGGLLRAVAWLPATLMPLLLVATFSEGDGLRLRHVFLSLRRSRSPVAEQPLPVAMPFFVLILVAAAVGSPSGTQAATLFLPAASALAALALFAVRRRGASLWPWLLCTLLALGLGAVFAAGLGRLQTALEEAVVEWLSASDTTLEGTTTRIGDLGRVKRSPTIVWRIRSERPPELPMLLFEAAYGRFAGQSWLAAGERFEDLGDSAGRLLQLGPAPADAASPRSRLRLEGLPRGEASILPLPATPLSLGPGSGGRFQRSASGSLRLMQPPPYLALEVEYLAATAAAAPPPGPAYLSLPAAESPVLKRIAARLAEAGAPATPQQKVEILRRYFADGFRYSLELGEGQRDLARFLEVSRAGHCEYYATATTLLLRAMGVPARYAVGFSLQEYEAASRSWVLRRRHAHAWAQAWIDGRWVDVDTTPGEWVGAEAEAASWPWQPLLDRLSWWWQEFQAWRLEGDDRKLRHGAMALALLTLLALAWRIWRRPRVAAIVAPAAPARIVTPLAQVDAELAGRFGSHCSRAPGETPRRWLARLRADGCPGLAPPLETLVELHDRFHFGAAEPGMPAAMEKLAAEWRVGLAGAAKPD